MTTTTLVSHPIANAYPAMTDSEYVGLKESINKNGVRNPIIMYENMILDGRHRYMACKELGIEPPTIEFTTEFPDQCPVEYVRDINSNRRSLTASQRAAVAVALLPLIEIEAKKRQGRTASPASSKGKSSEKAAAATGASTRMVERAKAVAEASPELIEKVKSGELTVGEAEEQIEESGDSDHSHNQDLDDSPDFMACVKKIKAALVSIEELSRKGSGRLLNMQQIEAALSEASGAVMFAMPYCECPYSHDDKDKTCTACGGSEWLTKAQHDRLPKSMKKKSK